MPAKRSRTLHWRRCLEQIHERRGAIEIAIARNYEGDEGNHLIWRVRVLAVRESEIVVEQPMALGQPVHIRAGMDLVAIMTVGQNRWMFKTHNIGGGFYDAGGRQMAVFRLATPDGVQRCQRRNHHRVQTTALSLPSVEAWPLLDPKSVVLAERANELRFERDRKGLLHEDEVAELSDEQIRPEIGPRFAGLLLNVGGGGVGLLVEPGHAQSLVRHKVFWLQIALPPELETPICATAKLIHTHMQSDQSTYAGMAFDFTFNTGHQRFVADQICRFVSRQQEGVEPLRKSA